jgi:hypothetical protein
MVLGGVGQGLQICLWSHFDFLAAKLMADCHRWFVCLGIYGNACAGFNVNIGEQPGSSGHTSPQGVPFGERRRDPQVSPAPFLPNFLKDASKITALFFLAIIPRSLMATLRLRKLFLTHRRRAFCRRLRLTARWAGRIVAKRSPPKLGNDFPYDGTVFAYN